MFEETEGRHKEKISLPKSIKFKRLAITQIHRLDGKPLPPTFTIEAYVDSQRQQPDHFAFMNIQSSRLANTLYVIEDNNPLIIENGANSHCEIFVQNKETSELFPIKVGYKKI